MCKKKYWKKILKGIVGVILMAALVTDITACGKNQKEYEEQAAGMLEEKYGERFIVEEYLGQELFGGYYTVKCYPEMNPRILFEAEAAYDGSYIEDNYISVEVCDKAEQQIDKNLEHLDGYLLEKVVPVSRSVDSDHADMDMAEFMALKPKNRFAVYLMYCPQKRDVGKVYREIQKTFQGLECMSGNIQLYIMREEELKKMQDYFSEVIDLDDRFEKMTEDVSRITVSYENGMIQMTEEEFEEKAGGLV